MDLQLQDKTALITGGSKGIGLRTAKALAHEGCRVAICGRDQNDLDVAKRQLETISQPVIAVRADVCQPADAERLVNECAETFGRIDVLVNNVGGARSSRLMDSTDEDWLRTFEVNVFQTVRMIRLAVPHMREHGGAIVNVASISGWEPQLAGVGQYGSAKAALIFLTEVLALELVHDRIRVNTVSPGSIMFEGAGWDAFRRQHPDSFDEYVRDGFPMGRLGHPEEVADVIAFTASPRANWINGRHIPVDGLEQPVPVKEFKPW